SGPTRYRTDTRRTPSAACSCLLGTTPPPLRVVSYGAGTARTSSTRRSWLTNASSLPYGKSTRPSAALTSWTRAGSRGAGSCSAPARRSAPAWCSSWARRTASRRCGPPRWWRRTWRPSTSTWAAPRPFRCRAAWARRCCASPRWR
ncbi:hypothetical protein TSOC_015144, partial [Tetrabaena socialis]